MAISKAHYILSTLYIFIAISGRFADFSGTLNLENLLLYLIVFKVTFDFPLDIYLPNLSLVTIMG
jgi:hypothetical protein